MTIIAVQQRPVSTITKYALNAPRYTSYPTALKFEPLQDDIAKRCATTVAAIKW